ncbi:MAG TPA: hypothetical protein GXZ43_00295 [Clostridiaceae bacterium]|nr:hypothetical protein [Clostridiaceae bacterium]
MLSLEAILCVPLCMTIFTQAIFYLKPIELRIEQQAKIIATDRIAEPKNQPIYKFNSENQVINLQVNPQKVKEILSLGLDIKNSLWDRDKIYPEQNLNN